ncbi:hypothetical protein CEQ21_24130 [Niallia circulans]|uniref:NADH dehydrogenase subunit 4L n=1 Tax=Niallia circulans TaxID=1397 RepID=A0A553SNA7_NIACI|nr:hypothetical protein [Niallia circulans]TRZ38480.1 hypothetical protein CEQ21_24130 [Niallia circulans]
MNEKNTSKINPLVLTVALIIAAFLVLVLSRVIQNINLWVVIVIYFLIDIGFIVAMVIGIRTKIKPVVIISILGNSVLFVFMTIFVLLLTLAMGISEP